MEERLAIIDGITRLVPMEKTMKIKSILIGTAVLALGLTAGAGQEEKLEESAPRHRVLNLSLFYPVSLNRSKHDTANLSLSLLYGHLGSVRGLDLSLGVAALERSLEGVQIGLVNAAEEIEGFPSLLLLFRRDGGKMNPETIPFGLRRPEQ
jgi:hypothetical protein